MVFYEFFEFFLLYDSFSFNLDKGIVDFEWTAFVFFSHFLIDYALGCLMNCIKHVVALIVPCDCVLIMLFLKAFYLRAM
jgi:hypothetical protein